MPIDNISMCSNTLYMSNMDVGSSLRWLSASTMMWWHHFDSTSDQESQNLRCMTATLCPWTAYEGGQTLCICLIWLWEAVWGGCQPQPWSNDIILTPQVTQYYWVTRQNQKQERNFTIAWGMGGILQPILICEAINYVCMLVSKCANSHYHNGHDSMVLRSVRVLAHALTGTGICMYGCVIIRIFFCFSYHVTYFPPWGWSCERSSTSMGTVHYGYWHTI